MEERIPGWDLLAGIGTCLTNWSLVELQMCALFDIISGMRDPIKARALFDTIVSFEVRLAILNSMMRFEPLSDSDRALWMRLAAKMGKLYRKRHEVAHFTISPDGSSVAPFMTWDAIASGTQKQLSGAQIGERAEKFFELADAMRWFKHYMAVQRTNDQLSRELVELVPPLIVRLRALEAQKPDGTPKQPAY